MMHASIFGIKFKVNIPATETKIVMNRKLTPYQWLSFLRLQILGAIAQEKVQHFTKQKWQNPFSFA